MNKPALYVGILIVILFLFILFYLITPGNQLQTSSSGVGYRILSVEDYNESKCVSLSSGRVNQNTYPIGFRLIYRDKVTGGRVNGTADYSTGNSGGNMYDDYACIGNLDSKNLTLSVYSRGYTPNVFTIDFPKNKLATLEVQLTKSCTGGPSLFDNLDLKAGSMENKTRAEEYKKDSTDYFYEMVEVGLGLNRSDLVLECAEGDLKIRWGYVKAKGKIVDGSKFELYYYWGGCSSGGSCDGPITCIKTDSDKITRITKGENFDCINGY